MILYPPDRRGSGHRPRKGKSQGGREEGQGPGARTKVGRQEGEEGDGAGREGQRGQGVGMGGRGAKESILRAPETTNELRYVLEIDGDEYMCEWRAYHGVGGPCRAYLEQEEDDEEEEQEEILYEVKIRLELQRIL